MTSWLRSFTAPAVYEVKASAGALARKTVLMAVGAFAFAVAAGFIVAAAYTAIHSAYGPIAAQLSLAGFFVLLGIVFLVMARASSRHRHPVSAAPRADGYADYDPDAPASLPTIASAFALGFARGLRRRTH
jgi:hypothetical protein